jgi:hypothetical protein
MKGGKSFSARPGQNRIAEVDRTVRYNVLVLPVLNADQLQSTVSNHRRKSVFQATEALALSDASEVGAGKTRAE